MSDTLDNYAQSIGETMRLRSRCAKLEDEVEQMREGIRALMPELETLDEHTLYQQGWADIMQKFRDVAGITCEHEWYPGNGWCMKCWLVRTPHTRKLTERHPCPDWDGMRISPDSPEWASCTCVEYLVEPEE
jgi:hypothetical protein